VSGVIIAIPGIHGRVSLIRGRCLLPFVEGQGRVAPRPVEIHFKVAEREAVYRQHQSISQYRGYDKERPGWRKGYNQNAGGVGLMGEYALAQFFRRHGIPCEVDTQLHPKGDGGKDFVIYGKHLQVKTSTGFYETQLNRRIDDQGNLVALKADLVAFSVFPSDGLIVYLLGWVSKDKLEDSSALAKARRKDAKHWNNEYPTNALEPMNRLVAYLRSAKEVYVTD